MASGPERAQGVIVPRRPGNTLGRLVEHVAKLSPPRNRELVRGMTAEFESIDDPADRMRFGLGAIAAIARLAVRGYAQNTVHALGRFVGVREPEAGATFGGPTMSRLEPRQLLRRLATPFVVLLASLTLLLLIPFAARQVPLLSARGATAGAVVEVLLLAVPFVLAMTIPMAVFIAVSWVFSRLGAEGVLASAARERHGVRRLLTPVLAFAAVIAALTFASNTQVLPRANTRLAAALDGAPRGATDRTMTVTELREAAHNARAAGGEQAAARAAGYEVEVQKKFALAAACIVLALAAAATAIRFPRGGLALVLGASGFVFTAYYLSLLAGESLADRQVISPFVAMWMANALLLAVVLLLVWRPARPGTMNGAETLVIGG